MSLEYSPHSTPALHSTVVDAIRNVAQSLEVERAEQLVTQIFFVVYPDGMTVANVEADGPHLAMAIRELMYISEYYNRPRSFDDLYEDIVRVLEEHQYNMQTIARLFLERSSQLQAMERETVRTKSTIRLLAERVWQCIRRSMQR